MRYEWNEAKSQTKRKKHGISFELATLVFEDEYCLVRPDRTDDTVERRWYAIGTARIERVTAVLLVVHAYRENRHGEEIIRIISAREAEAHEVRSYRQQALD